MTCPRLSPAFDSWFRDSQVVDGLGCPRVVYHGTTAGGFESFLARFRKGEQLGFGIHFAEDPAFASEYANGSAARRGSKPFVFAVYLSIQRPLDVERQVSEGSAEFDLAAAVAGRKFFALRDSDGRRAVWLRNALEQGSPERASKLLQAAGYDGVRYEARLLSAGGYGWSNSGSSASWIAFRPEQVKAAYGARLFDPHSPDLLRGLR